MYIEIRKLDSYLIAIVHISNNIRMKREKREIIVANKNTMNTQVCILASASNGK